MMNSEAARGLLIDRKETNNFTGKSRRWTVRAEGKLGYRTYLIHACKHIHRVFSLHLGTYLLFT